MATVRKLRGTKQVPIYLLRIQLLHVVPAVWRKVLVPGSIKLNKLHSVLLNVMGWEGGHLHEFIFEQGRYGTPDPYHPDFDTEVQDDTKITLVKALGPFASFTYLYDFGDGWEHIVTIDEIYPPDPEFKHPKCIDGQNACPPEDVGGPWGYQDFLEAISDTKHENHKEMMEWCGGSFDPKQFDLAGVNEIFSGSNN